MLSTNVKALIKKKFVKPYRRFKHWVKPSYLRLEVYDDWDVVWSGKSTKDLYGGRELFSLLSEDLYYSIAFKQYGKTRFLEVNRTFVLHSMTLNGACTDADWFQQHINRSLRKRWF
ncbi:MAG: hypothetical protein IBX57_01055 [Gammaproteobacteria bacterium]|nr:hypothetical protein [Gammaproteobacteria bacterium]